MRFLALGRPRRQSPTVATAEDFEEFLAARAAFVSQRSTIHYCYARAGVNWDKLLREEAFAQAMERCRWEAYAAAASGLALLYEGLLREAARGRELILAESLVRCLQAVLHRYPVPAHDPEAWDRELEGFRVRLGQAQQAAPLAAHLHGGPCGRRIFAVLPIHRRLRAHDAEMVENSLRFAFVNQHDEAVRAFDIARLAPALAGSRSRPAAARRGQAGEAPAEAAAEATAEPNAVGRWPA